jgi:hypothetical protein
MKPKKMLIVAAMVSGFSLPLVTSAEETIAGGVNHLAALLQIQAADQQFKQLDVDRDGYIDRQEAARAPDVAARFDHLDADGDGRISAEEWIGQSIQNDYRAS